MKLLMMKKGSKVDGGGGVSDRGREG